MLYLKFSCFCYWYCCCYFCCYCCCSSCWYSCCCYCWVSNSWDVIDIVVDNVVCFVDPRSYIQCFVKFGSVTYMMLLTMSFCGSGGWVMLYLVEISWGCVGKVTIFVTLGSILDSQLSWKSGKFQLALWSMEPQTIITHWAPR